MINCSRGAVINEEDLFKIVRNKEISGAHLDVFSKKSPNLNNPLFHMDEITITPHMASNTVKCTRKVVEQATSQIDILLSGYQPTWSVNRPVFKVKR